MPKVKWPEKTYLVSNKYKLIYCPIPKNASSRMKTIFMDLEGVKQNFREYSSRHNYLRKGKTKLMLKDYNYEDAQCLLHHDSYFKFVILRNVFSRLVSAYLSKFVVTKDKTKKKKPYRNLIKEVCMSQAKKINIEKSISFSQFINYINNVDKLKDLDVHWRPQYTFLGFNKFDGIYSMDNLDPLFDLIESKVDSKLITEKALTREKSKNKLYYNQDNKQKSYEHYFPDDFEKLGFLPFYKQMYNSQMINIVLEKYEEDIKIYERKFNVTLNI